MFESNGSNALKREYEYELPVEREKKIAKRPKKSRKLSPRNKASLVAGVAVLFALAFIVLMFKAVLNTEYKNLSTQKAELERLTSEVEQLNSQIEGSGSLVAVEEKAAELGLVSASEGQIVYLSLDNTDKGEILAEDKSNRGIHLFFNKVAVIAEYLY